MRIAHATDIHWFVPPRVGELAFKRMLGTANLYLRGRRRRFSRTVQQALVEHMVELAPDAVMITGDLTSLSLDAEFEVARRDLTPVLDAVPTFLVPGNHDVYTPGAKRTDAMGQTFGPWMGDRSGSGLSRLDVGRLTFLGLDPNRPTLLAASGRVPEEQLTELAEVLQDPSLAQRHVILAIHYPMLDRRGDVYDGSAHGLLNAKALIQVLDSASVRPRLIACGHVHHGFRVELPLSDGARIPICNCGSSGYAHEPERRRTASMGLYELTDDGAIRYERYQYDGTRFAPEPGGAWATGR